jgi:hypothetical protein
MDMKSLFIFIFLGLFIHIRFGMMTRHEMYRWVENNYVPSLQPHYILQRLNICELTEQVWNLFAKNAQEIYVSCIAAILLALRDWDPISSVLLHPPLPA